jgi:hypothetical protein
MRREVDVADWDREGIALFGEDRKAWRFVCPSCGHIAKASDWKEAGAPPGSAAFSCVGRWLPQCEEAFTKRGPCNYAGGGLFAINPVRVRFPDGKTIDAFEFAPLPECHS